MWYMNRRVEFFGKWAEYKKEESDFAPNKKTLDWYSCKKDLKLQEIEKLAKEAESNLEKLDKGSIWEPKSFLTGLLHVFFPDSYHGKI